MTYLFETEEHAALREQVARFAQNQIAPHAQAFERAGEFPIDLYKQAGAAGILGVGFPVELGGSGGDITHQLVAGEAMVLHGRSVGTAVGLGSHTIALPLILSFGSEAQKQRFVPQILSGDLVAALAVTEPDGGSDVAALQTRARQQGSEYLVNGAKLYITSGVRADVIVTAVRTNPDPAARHMGLSLLLVEKHHPGFSASRKLDKMGWSASDTAELSFADCRVPAQNLLGEEGGAFFALVRNFAAERLLLSGQCVAIAELALAESVAFAKSRSTFGKPLCRHQVIRHKLADMATRLAAARALVGECAVLCQRQEARMKPNPPEDPVGRRTWPQAEHTTASAYRPDAESNAAWSRTELGMSQLAMCKNTATDMCSFVVDQAVQIHGGLGYMRETLVENLYRDARLYPIGGGTREIMNEIIAQQEGY